MKFVHTICPGARRVNIYSGAGPALKKTGVDPALGGTTPDLSQNRFQSTVRSPQLIRGGAVGTVNCEP